ncbi:hypothetical protein [Proteus mirabilis]|uniref:hypothetical protein n=1 Tax=Proteus mirabilis TaxID=584 RepID=UPI0003841B4C|nr:hypothetical protein [Proteus mirabilis]AGS59796.1 hypothetical protein BB2000_1303 [Proteus mirabilis BB2000]
MILLNINQTDYLTPIKDIPYYTDFISKYSYITTACNVLQGMIIPVHKDDKDVLDENVTAFINTLPEDSIKRRKLYRVYAKGAHIDVGDIIQENEKRTFASTYFIEEANKNNISQRELVLRTLNNNVFLQYYFLLEETLKNIFLETNASYDPKKITGSQAITLCLNRRLNHFKNKDRFIKSISERSKFFITWKTLTLTWDLLTLIRNRCVHHNNLYDTTSINKLKKIIDKILKELKKSEGSDLTALYFSNSIESIISNIEENGYILFNNTLENMVRNTSIFIIESLYLCEIE